MAPAVLVTANDSHHLGIGEQQALAKGQNGCCNHIQQSSQANRSGLVSGKGSMTFGPDTPAFYGTNGEVRKQSSQSGDYRSPSSSCHPSTHPPFLCTSSPSYSEVKSVAAPSLPKTLSSPTVNGFTSGHAKTMPSTTNGYNSHIPFAMNGNPRAIPLRSSGLDSAGTDIAPATPISPIQAPGKTPIAICGLSLRLPGSITTPSAFWDLLLSGSDARGPIPPSRYSAAGFSSSLGAKGGDIKTQHGYFLSDDLGGFDAGMFSMGRSEVERADPQQRLLLEVVRESFEDAGEMDYRGKSVGCYVGTFGDGWQELGGKETMHERVGYVVLGGGDLMIANRVSYEFDLKGPSMCLKTGCSASLVALHEACRALQNGDASGAIVAGTSLIFSPTTTAAFTEEGLLSSDGSCKTFDSSANGFARAEAITALYIKPLADALRDGNPVRAVIQATATNSDGRSNGLLSPNGKAHEAMMRKIYEDSGLDPGDTAFVECHGTGTATGDPIEANAVGNVFGEKGVFIGSVKPNVGHSEGSSGITSMIKCILALENGVIPPNIKFKSPNPKIPFAEKKLVVPVKPTPFPQDRAERISINSFGIGGANAHVILEAYRPSEYHAHSPLDYSNGQITLIERPVPLPTRNKPELLVFSANTPSSLNLHLSNYREYIKTTTAKPSDIAYTLLRRREHLPHRAYAILQDGEFLEMSGVGQQVGAKSKPALYFVFNGQGGQWAGMGRELIERDATFKEDILAMDGVLQGLIYPPEWRIIDELQKPEATSRINEAELSQPLCTALQIALFNRLSASGIKPTSAVGHSSGEIAAVYASGLLTMELAIIISYYRGYVTKSLPHARIGGMAAIGLGAEEVLPYLPSSSDVLVACENSPSSTTISGPRSKVLDVVETIKTAMPGTSARMLKVDMGYHSPLMMPLATTYMELMYAEMQRRGIILSTQSCFISSVSGEMTEPPRPFGPEYWARNLTSPVLFSSSVMKLLERNGDGLFVEIGPHSVLAGPLRQICASVGRPCEYVGSMLRGQDCSKSLQSCFGKLFQAGVDVDFTPLCPSGEVVTGLPAYPWDHTTSFWYESRLSSSWRLRKYPHHCLLGSRVTDSPDHNPLWRNILRLDNEPWIADHKVKDDIVLPFAAYVAMAGEAVRQSMGLEACGYNLRHVVVRTGLVMSDAKSPEMVTSLKKHMHTDNDESGWWDFSISSYTGSSWVVHCDGRVKSNTESRKIDVRRGDLPRRVNMDRFYGALGAVGIAYGPEFKRLQGVTTWAKKESAFAQIRKAPPEQMRGFVQHPVAIDNCLQLLLVAMSTGLERNIPGLAVPTCIEEVDVISSANNDNDMSAFAWGTTGLKQNGVECTSGGNIAIRICGIELTPLEDDKDEVFDPHAGARLEWVHHADFLDMVPYIEPPASNISELILLEEMTLLCILENAEQVKDLIPCQPHYSTFRKWLDRQATFAHNNVHPIVESPERFAAMTTSERVAAIEEKHDKLCVTSKKALAIANKRVYSACTDMFVGTTKTIDILMQDSILKELYNTLSFEYSKLFKVLASTTPTLRILEVGAGTGGATSTILPHLIDKAGMPMYSMYTFTDISAGFFPQAKERFSYARNVEFKTFDLEVAPGEQGIDVESYDIVVAFNVVHATASLNRTLNHLNETLKPGGRLLLIEASTVSKTVNYLFGNFEGWWMGEKDDRYWEPYVGLKRWDEELRAAGFTGNDTVVCDNDGPYRLNAAIVSQRVKPTPVYKDVVVLCKYPKGRVADMVIAQLRRSERSVTTARLGEIFPKDEVDIVSCIDLEANFFEDIDSEAFASFQTFLGQRIKGKILWLTSPVQIECQAPQSAPAIGVARTVRAELGIPFCTLEIDRKDPEFAGLVGKVFDKICEEEDAGTLASDREYAIHEGKVCVSRYHAVSVADEFASRSIEGVDKRRFLTVEKAGLLETLYWQEQALADVEEGHVEFEPKVIGLNFRDVLLAMGVMRVPSPIPLGLEGSAVVTRVGAGVQGINPGDRVMFLAGGGCLATRVSLPKETVVKIPDRLKDEEAATIPAVFVTALMSLLDLGRLREGKSVLIQAAAGGVGLAAIQVARLVGAEIYATCGSERKVDFLTGVMGIPRDHIFNSRDASFVEGLMAATGDEGVDVVLNSASGELLHASWKCVAEFGTMVDIGKRDMLGSGRLDMRPFSENRVYCGYDAKEIIHKRPQEIHRWLNKFLAYYMAGQLKPIEHVTVHGEANVEKAFRTMQGGVHIGKILIQLGGGNGEVDGKMKVQKKKALGKEVRFDPTGTYLLTGGFGGLGQSLITWMAERGARSITILSRSAGSSESNKAFVKEVGSMGCNITSVVGKVDEMEDVKRAVAACNSPIKGVFHLAMVLRDSALKDMSWSDWDQVMKPKVVGTWNLHNALLDQNLDIFWLASSLVTSIEQLGQGNYSAANTFLEAFCQYRRNSGLPASVLGICPVDGVGFVAENPLAKSNCARQDLMFLGEREFLDFLELSIVNSSPDTQWQDPHESPDPSPEVAAITPFTWKNQGHLVMGLRSEKDLDDPTNRANWRLDRRMGIYHNLRNETSGNNTGDDVGGLKAFLAKAAEDPDILSTGVAVEELGREIGVKLNDFMIRPGQDVDTSLSLAQIGLDSLMAVELRRWFKQALGLQTSVLEIMGVGSLYQLAEEAVQKLRVKFSGGQ